MKESLVGKTLQEIGSRFRNRRYPKEVEKVETPDPKPEPKKRGRPKGSKNKKRRKSAADKKLYDKRYYQENREKILARARERYAERTKESKDHTRETGMRSYYRKKIVDKHIAMIEKEVNEAMDNYLLRRNLKDDLDEIMESAKNES